ncbi:MAG: hypothetical protein ACKO27_08755, partial [Ilumatobacteraceae bacterium]
MSTVNNKRRAGFAALLVVLGLGVGAGTTAIVLATTNPAIVRGGQVATLSWYANNYATGAGPRSAATDGTNIWTANGTGSVTKINATTGVVAGTYALPAGS